MNMKDWWSLMKKQQVIILAGMAVLGLAFNNCSQAGSIALKASPTEGSNSVTSAPDNQEPDPQQPPLMPPKDPVQQIIANCQQAAAAGKLMVANQNVTFDDSRVETGKNQICDFAAKGTQMTANGDLEMLNGYMQARYEQTRKLVLPDNAVICDIAMKNDLQSFRYDDVFFFSFNGYLLASNNMTEVKQRLTPSSQKLSDNEFTDIYTYDWTKLRTGTFQNQADDYCLGADQGLSSCSWPVSEQQGQIKFSFAQSLLVSMSAGRKASDQSFTFVITGDNDPSLDCYHEKLDFSMSVKYYIPQK